MYIENVFQGDLPDNLASGHVAIMECLMIIPEHYTQKVECKGVIFTDYPYTEAPQKIELLKQGSHIVIHEFNDKVSEQTVRHSFADSFARLFVFQNRNVNKILKIKSKALPKGVLGNAVTAEDLFVLAFASIVSELNKRTGLSRDALSFFADVDQQIKYEYTKSTL